MSLRDFQSWGLDNAAPPAGWAAFDQLPTFSLTGGRFSDGALHFTEFSNNYASGNRGLRAPFDAQRTWFVGVPLMASDLASPHRFLGLLSGPTDFQVSLALNTAGFIEAYQGSPQAGTLLGTGSHLVTIGTWYFVELGAYIDNSAGTLQVFVNGMLDLDLSGIDTQALAGDTADTIVLGGFITATGGALSFWLGQIYVCDDQGASENTFLGDCRVIAQVPTGDGAHAEWTPLTGGDQYAMVDEIPPDGDTSYVSSRALGAIDTFTFPALGVTGTVIAVKTCMDAERDDVGYRAIAPVIRQLGTDYIYADVVASAGSYAKFTETFLVRPSDGNPWQASDLATTEFGVAVTG